jgi:septal ring factor EnvC (AmiA/AmiB activator)
MFNSEKIATLQAELEASKARVTALETEVSTLTASREETQAQLATATESAATLQASLNAANEKIAKLETDHTAEVARINGDVEQRIQTEVTNRCAAAGVEPIARDPEAGSKADDTKGAPAAGLSGIAKARALLSEKHKALYGGKN